MPRTFPETGGAIGGGTDAMSSSFFAFCNMLVISDTGMVVYIRPYGFMIVTVGVPRRLKPSSQRESARTPAG